jgi:hypothetical protein
MLILPLNGVSWRTRDDFYDALFVVLGAPIWHGRNFNALRDSIGTGGINTMEPPYYFVITGRPEMGAESQKAVTDFCELIRELKDAGCAVEVSCD